MELDLSIVLIGSTAVLFAGFLRGLTGFGFALIAVPVLSVLVSPKLVVPLIVIHGLAASVPLIFGARHHAQPRRIWPLIVTGSAGVPFGSYLLLVLDADALRLMIGGVAVVSAGLLMTGFKYQVKRELLAYIPVGLASGVLQGSSGLAGPPVILFFTNQGVPPLVFRANILAFFFVQGIATVAAFTVAGLFSRDAFVLSAIFAPALLVGTYSGARFASKATAGLFKAIAITVVLLGGASAIASGLEIL
jgi:uncharacterized membrane protein YfcA